MVYQIAEFRMVSLTGYCCAGYLCTFKASGEPVSYLNLQIAMNQTEARDAFTSGA